MKDTLVGMSDGIRARYQVNLGISVTAYTMSRNVS